MRRIVETHRGTAHGLPGLVGAPSSTFPEAAGRSDTAADEDRIAPRTVA